MPWKAAAVPEPKLLVLNEPLAAELGLDAAGLRSPDGLRPAGRHRLPDGRDAGRPGLRRPPVRRLRRRAWATAARCCSASSIDADGRGCATCTSRAPGARRSPAAGDGLAAVGPMLREYVISEAMHALGIPTTRALAVVATGEPVAPRDAAARRRAGPGREQPPAGRHLPVRRRHRRPSDRAAPARRPRDRPAPPERRRAPSTRYLALFDAVVAAQASLVARWMLVGFVHGVMNTDNMTISGETIDYGPCAFMEAFDPRHGLQLDRPGRPLRLRQPARDRAVEPGPLRRGAAPAARTRTIDAAIEAATAWSCGVPPSTYAPWPSGMRAKLGLSPTPARRRWPTTCSSSCSAQHVDYTSFFRSLAAGTARRLFAEPAPFDAWADRGWRRCCRAAGPRRRRRWTGSTRSTSRATTSSRRRSTAATAGDLAPFRRLVDVVSDRSRSAPAWTLRPAGTRGLRPRTSRSAAPDARIGGDVARCPGGVRASEPVPGPGRRAKWHSNRDKVSGCAR